LNGEGVNFSRHNLLFRLKANSEFLLPAGAGRLTLDPTKYQNSILSKNQISPCQLEATLKTKMKQKAIIKNGTGTNPWPKQRLSAGIPVRKTIHL
jgi:hypothetical protein